MLFEHLPIIILAFVLIAVIMAQKNDRRDKLMISRDNRLPNAFKNENDMILYVTMLLDQLQKLKHVEKGPDYASTP